MPPLDLEHLDDHFDNKKSSHISQDTTAGATGKNTASGNRVGQRPVYFGNKTILS